PDGARRDRPAHVRRRPGAVRAGLSRAARRRGRSDHGPRPDGGVAVTPRARAPRELTELERVGRIQTGLDTWTMHFSWAKNPLPMNGTRGGSWRKGAREEKNVRDAAVLRVRNAAIPRAG